MTCREAVELIQLWLDGESVDGVALQRHLDECEACRGRQAAYAAMRGALSQADDADVPDTLLPGLKYRIDSKKRRPEFDFSRLGFAAALVIGMLVWYVYQGPIGPQLNENTPDALSASVTEARNELSENSIISAADSAAGGRVMWDSADDYAVPEALPDTRGLTEPSGERVFTGAPPMEEGIPNSQGEFGVEPELSGVARDGDGYEMAAPFDENGMPLRYAAGADREIIYSLIAPLISAMGLYLVLLSAQ
jgi:hypothetical protein